VILDADKRHGVGLYVSLVELRTRCRTADNNWRQL